MDSSLTSPIQKYLIWFETSSPSQILNGQDDEIFKKQLKSNLTRAITILNKAFQDKVDAWKYFNGKEHVFNQFFKGAAKLAISRGSEFDLSIADRYQILTFLNYSFNSIEVEFVNKQVRKFLSLAIWCSLSDIKIQTELAKLPEFIQEAWNKLKESDKTLSDEKLFERTFMFKYVQQFLRILPGSIVDNSDTQSSNVDNDADDQTELEDRQSSNNRKVNSDYALYCQRFLEFMIDIESQLPLRRFFHAILEYVNFIERCRLSDLAKHPSRDGHLFERLLELLILYSHTEVNAMTGQSLTKSEIYRKHEAEILDLQRVIWRNYPNLKKFATKSVRTIDNPNMLYQIVTSFDSGDKLLQFLVDTKTVDIDSLDEDDKLDIPLLASLLINRYRRIEPKMKKINSIPLFPNESLIWDNNLVPDEYYNFETPLALPKLNLQFLTMSDYLLRNFMLFKNESTYEIRKDLEDSIIKSKCRWTKENTFATGPKQRFALIIKEFSILDVCEPKLGEQHPSKVKAKVVINMDYVRPEWRREWEQLRKHDACFLISFRKPDDSEQSDWPENSFPHVNNIRNVRGCEIEALLDSEGVPVNDRHESPNFSGNLRTYIVSLDCNQYQADVDSCSQQKLDIYEKFHLFVRRKPEKNNFKGVLDTIRTMMNTEFVVPDWLRSLLIGFGDPANAHYTRLMDPNKHLTLDMLHTFSDYDHLTSNLNTIMPDFAIEVQGTTENNVKPEPPFKIELNHEQKLIRVKPYKTLPRGPYQALESEKNKIRFTPKQTEAIISGLQHGLTMVVGPPGTGKTDVAVQILSSLYHNYPNQRTLIVTHSNHALNQIFEKMLCLGVEEHHMLRLGHGEEDLDTQKDFTREGRVNHILEKRRELLEKVKKLSISLELEPGQEFTCQSSEYFNLFHILPRWSKYSDEVLQSSNIILDEVSEKFPFKKFFNDLNGTLFKKNDIRKDIDTAQSCYRYIEDIFTTLQAFRPFEIFQSPADRSQYLLIKEAKLIAMTCTHAGLKRRELSDLNFQYDNILMEESAQILEIETAITLLLQNPENGHNRLRRWIMIGDHNQLPPIIQNSSFQKFSNMEQSLFTRFIRLGVPHVELDAQGRTRESICDLYRWRYKNLQELDNVKTPSQFKQANAGYAYEYQFIDVNGSSESTPPGDPYFYQNHDEAKYCISLYKFMIEIGYPAKSITILTTYNGQRQLLRDLMESAIQVQPYIQWPSSISTVDKFQGQQNDMIIVSLVRTKHVGHIRDIRRLVVAMSRARLGLYIVGSFSLFSNCYELKPTFDYLKNKPCKLALNWPIDRHPTSRKISEPPNVKLISGYDELDNIVSSLKDN